jgi:hypothetical protein
MERPLLTRQRPSRTDVRLLPGLVGIKPIHALHKVHRVIPEILLVDVPRNPIASIRLFKAGTPLTRTLSFPTTVFAPRGGGKTSTSISSTCFVERWNFQL